MKNSKIRVGIVGCGRVSRTAHYGAINENDEYEFVCVCDTDRARADEWAAANGVKAYYSVEDMLREEKLDLVSVNAPNVKHPEIGILAAKAGANVMSEKPLGMTLKAVDELIDACRENDVRLFTVHQNRFNATNQLLKRAVEKGRFGKLLSCEVVVRWHRGAAYYAEDHGWRGSKEMAGGVFTNQSVHYVDIMQWLVNSRPSLAFAQMDTAVHDITAETHGAAVISFENGVIGNLFLTALNYPDDLEGSLTLLGTHGSVKVGGKSMNRILEWDFADEDPEDDRLAAESDYEPPTVYGFGHIEMYRRIGEVLLHDRDTEVPDGYEGRKAVEILDALYRSATEGVAVAFAPENAE